MGLLGNSAMLAVGFAAGVWYREHYDIDYDALEALVRGEVAKIPARFDAVLDFLKTHSPPPVLPRADMADGGAGDDVGVGRGATAAALGAAAATRAIAPTTYGMPAAAKPLVAPRRPAAAAVPHADTAAAAAAVAAGARGRAR